MNNFETTFFKKYIPKWQEVKWVVHQHWIKIIWKLIFIIIMFVFIPCFLYYISLRIRELVPFYYLEIYLFLAFFKLIYDVFDWYNDVWIMTDEWLVDLKWALFKTDLTTIKYENIEWIEVEQNWFIDIALKKWNIIIHKIWDEAETFVIEDAIIPYNALNEIERISKEKEEQENEDEEKENDKFDMIMSALSWVVENYLENKIWNKQEEEKQREFLEKYKWKYGTIDLRK